MSTDIYIIAVKRDMRGSEPPDWKEKINRLDEVEVLSSTGPRLRISTSEEAIKRIRMDWNNLFHIEKQIVHNLQAKSDPY